MGARGPSKSKGDGPEGAAKSGDGGSGAAGERMWMLKTPQHLGGWARGWRCRVGDLWVGGVVQVGVWRGYRVKHKGMVYGNTGTTQK